MDHLESLWGKPLDAPPYEIRGILQTTDYERFQILSDVGDVVHRFEGAALANRCLPGDHVGWDKGACVLELRDEHPPIVCTLELTSKSTYGLTKRGHMMYLCTPYDRRYPPFIAGSSERDRTRNHVVLVELEKKDGEVWRSGQFPRALIQRTFGVTGDPAAEREALIWQACPFRYPAAYDYRPVCHDKGARRALSGYTFHIDPPGCRDVDDVVTFEAMEDGWRVAITIADVQAYVEDGSPVDIMASLIGQTLYDAEGRVLRPMLPPAYSEGVCSLLPQGSTTQRGLSLLFDFVEGGIKNIEWCQTTLHVDQSYTYESFGDTEWAPRVRDLAIALGGAAEGDAHDWVAQLMIFYNTEAGRWLKREGQGVLRRHRAPDRERLEALKRVEGIDLTALAYAAAEYCLAEEEDTVHYGLAAEAYAHASSPLRRYADLINQRVLVALLQHKDRVIVPQAMYDMNARAKAVKRFARDMDLLAAIVSGEQTFEAILVEREVTDGVKLRLYVPAWRRMISTRYRVIDGKTLSRDETREIDTTLYRHTTIRCVWQPNARNWKERAIIEVL
jgi:exoribonuclease R